MKDDWDYIMERDEMVSERQLTWFCIITGVVLLCILGVAVSVLAVPTIRIQPAPGQRGTVLTASDAGAHDYYGVSSSLSADGSVLAVGAYYWDGAGGVNQGCVYVYDIGSPRPIRINGKTIRVIP
jgi:hypothetical protein